MKLRGRLDWRVPASVLALAALGLVGGCKATASLPVRIVGFGPTPVEHGEPFNVQPDGASAIWVRADKPVDSRDVLVLDGHQLRTTIAGDLLTAVVPLEVISSPGRKPLFIELDSDKRPARSAAVSFVVK